MNTRYGLLAVATAILMAMPAPTAAQGRGGQAMRQQDPMRQHVMRMDAAIQRMDQLRERLHVLDQDLIRQRDMLRDQDRIRQHDQFRELCNATDGVIGLLRQNMEQTRTMMGNPMWEHDPEMQREMDRLRQHWEMVAQQMEDGVGIMERLRERLRTPSAP